MVGHTHTHTNSERDRDRQREKERDTDTETKREADTDSHTYVGKNRHSAVNLKMNGCGEYRRGIGREQRGNTFDPNILLHIRILNTIFQKCYRKRWCYLEKMV